MLARDGPFRTDQLRDFRPVKVSAAALRALLAVALHQLLEARVPAQGSEIWAGIEGGKIVKSHVKRLLQRGQGLLGVPACRVCRGEPEIVDARRPNVLR